MLISDGLNFQQAMLATQLHNMVNDNGIETGCIIQLNDFICNDVHGRR